MKIRFETGLILTLLLISCVLASAGLIVHGWFLSGMPWAAFGTVLFMTTTLVTIAYMIRCDEANFTHKEERRDVSSQSSSQRAA